MPTVTDARHLYEEAVGLLGPTLVHAAIGLGLGQNLSVVADSPEMTRRLEVLLDAFRRVAVVEDADTARAMFIGANERLGEETMIMALRADRFDAIATLIQVIEAEGL